MNKLYIRTAIISALTIMISLYLCEIMPLASYIPYSPWIFYLMYLFFLDRKIQKLKRK